MFVKDDAEYVSVFGSIMNKDIMATIAVFLCVRDVTTLPVVCQDWRRFLHMILPGLVLEELKFLQITVKPLNNLFTRVILGTMVDIELQIPFEECGCLLGGCAVNLRSLQFRCSEFFDVETECSSYVLWLRRLESLETLTIMYPEDEMQAAITDHDLVMLITALLRKTSKLVNLKVQCRHITNMWSMIYSNLVCTGLRDVVYINNDSVSGWKCHVDLSEDHTVTLEVVNFI